MNTAKAARALDVNDRTLKLWIGRPELARFFSEQARRDGSGRDLSEQDIIVANTIRYLREGVGNNNVDWDGIADQLATGYRNEQLPATADTVTSDQSVAVIVAQQQQRVTAIQTERDAALKRAEQLEAELQREQQGRREDIERLMREVADARAQAAVLQNTVDLFEAGRLKPRK